MNKQKKGLIPDLRFAEFRDAGEWNIKPLSKIGDVITGNTPSTSDKENYNGDRMFVSPADISDHRFVSQTKITLSEKGLSKTRQIPAKNILFVCIGSTIGKVAQNMYQCATNQQINSVVPFEDNVNAFVYYALDLNSSKIAILAGKQAVPIINKTLFSTVMLCIPEENEQQKIADCLASIDELITLHTQKLNALKNHKKALIQQLFPREGETLPQLRFPEFRDTGEWEAKKLGDCLDYQQPTEYLVSETNYNNSYEIPVLTAGKTFILGYTNEKYGVFDKGLPVIIFDDFTTASKFVNFPFKVKSSAMKILNNKNGTDIKFMFEIMQTISYKPGAHERHWISKFASMSILMPKLDEQQKIADCLSSVDEIITLKNQQLAILKNHKKALMQQLFPIMDDAA